MRSAFSFCLALAIAVGCTSGDDVPDIASSLADGGVDAGIFDATSPQPAPPRPACTAVTLDAPYVDPRRLTALPFGTHGHWDEPWRAYLETPNASVLLDGLGINLNLTNGESPELAVRMLASHGMKRARIEIPWGAFRYDDESQLEAGFSARLASVLAACAKYGVRPLVLLNAGSGRPCPTQSSQKTVVVDAHAGDTQLHISDTTGLVAGRSGVSGLTDYWAAEAIITAISGTTITLSKPLPKAIAAGSAILVETLRHRPFSPSCTSDFADTVGGWKQYVTSVARIVSSALGTASSADRGFDLEVWNELTFGSHFLNVDEYYTCDACGTTALCPPLAASGCPYPCWRSDEVHQAIVRATASLVAASPADFAGVKLADGFANTVPWPASSSEPPEVAAIDKHPYPSVRNYPADDRQVCPPSDAGAGCGYRNLNALGADDPYVPTYRAVFPEYFAEALQTETLVRDLAPISTSIYGTMHGRTARTPPVPVWITEVNVDPGVDAPGVSVERALVLKAKAALRAYAFYLNKGATGLYLYAAVDHDLHLGVLLDDFVALARSPSATYPADDAAYTSPTLAAIADLARHVSAGLDRNAAPRAVTMSAVSACRPTVQWRGDGTKEHPDLRDIDVLAFLPYQVNAHRIAILYYVMTRDYTVDLLPEDFTMTIDGVSLKATASAYDPLAHAPIAVTVHDRSPGSITVTLPARDSPAILFLDD